MYMHVYMTAVCPSPLRFCLSGAVSVDVGHLACCIVQYAEWLERCLSNQLYVRHRMYTLVVVEYGGAL